ncbi:MAG: ElaB/YqjD/DUF883 family membrane-anchored ribosome-binding protein [Natronomonas sp.]|jgi:ElaB/YqjD/DUF883 family membrane-anchored ribosome-binding protein
MPDVDPSETVTTASDGVTVEKSFEPDDFPVPAIAFDLRSERETPASVQIVDTVPDDVAPENIGFHPKYGAEFWDADGDEIIFRRELAPEESYTTVYGLRGGDASVATKFLSEPRLELDPIAVESFEDSSAPPIHDMESTDEPELRDESGDASYLVSDPDHFDADPGYADSPDPESADRDEAGSGHRGFADPTADAEDGLLGTLAEELEAAEPDDPDLAALRAALGVESPTSVETRIEHLQSTVADLEAYTDALETFLDENGDAQEVLADLRERHDETIDRLDDVESTAEDAAEEIEATEDRLGATIDAVRADIEAIEADVATLSSELEAVLEMRSRLANAFDGGVSDSPAPGEDETADGADAGSADTRTGAHVADTDTITRTGTDAHTTVHDDGREEPPDRE